MLEETCHPFCVLFLLEGIVLFKRYELRACFCSTMVYIWLNYPSMVHKQNYYNLYNLGLGPHIKLGLVESSVDTLQMTI